MPDAEPPLLEQNLVVTEYPNDAAFRYESSSYEDSQAYAHIGVIPGFQAKHANSGTKGTLLLPMAVEVEDIFWDKRPWRGRRTRPLPKHRREDDTNDTIERVWRRALLQTLIHEQRDYTHLAENTVFSENTVCNVAQSRI